MAGFSLFLVFLNSKFFSSQFSSGFSVLFINNYIYFF
jgi:hypothetical protein